MSLHNLKPAQGSVKRQGKRVGRGEGSGKATTLVEVIKGLNLVQDILVKSDLKVVKCHYKDVCLNLDLTI